MIFYSGDGKVHGDGEGVIKEEGKGFYEGDLIKVTVDQKNGKIEWEVNGNKKASY